MAAERLGRFDPADSGAGKKPNGPLDPNRWRQATRKEEKRQEDEIKKQEENRKKQAGEQGTQLGLGT